MKPRTLEMLGAVARHIPVHQAQMFSFVASPRVRADPWKLYQRLHRTGPIRPGPDGTWIVASHHGVSAVLRHPNTSVDETRASGLPEIDRSGAFTSLMDKTMLFTDPPGHQRLRRLVSRSFTPSRVEALEDPVRCAAAELLDTFAVGGGGDLIDGFALPLPVAVIQELLGIPAGDRPRFLAWAQDIAPRLDIHFVRDEELHRRGDRGAEGLSRYLAELIDDPTARDPDGLIASVVDAGNDGDRLDRDEMIALFALLLLAGFETTTNLIVNSIDALISHPTQLAMLRDGEVPTTLAVEELLRFAGPVQLTQRVLLEDLSLDGRHLPAGSLVALLIGAANRDPAVFDRPDVLDLSRDPNPHLAFSFGIHHCLGAALARLEASIAIPMLLASLPRLHLAGRPRRRRTFLIRGFERYPVGWDAAAQH